MKQSTAIKYLSKDPLLHMDMLACIRSGYAQLLFASEAGVLLHNTACGAMMMSTEEENTAAQMLSMIAETSMFVAHQAFYRADVTRKFSFTQQMVCRQAAYLNHEPLMMTDSPIKIERLDERHLPFIMAHYSHADDAAYHRERLKSGVMYGAFLGRQLAGFIGLHAEGSIGMLEVLPEYRRKGIAYALEAFLVNRQLANGNVPFAQIVEGNDASLALHRKLNFSISEKLLCWLM